MTDIRNREILYAVLLQTLQHHPDGIDLHDVYAAIERTFSFPEEWYRQIPSGTGHDELTEIGIDDWRSIPQTRLVELVKTEPQWQNELRWARNDLRKRGLLDTSAPRGIWRLSPAGQASAERPLEDLAPSEREIATPKHRQEPKAQTAPEPRTDSGVTIRDGLLNKLATLTSSMPINDLELLVDIARTIRLRTLDKDS